MNESLCEEKMRLMQLQAAILQQLYVQIDLANRLTRRVQMLVAMSKQVNEYKAEGVPSVHP